MKKSLHQYHITRSEHEARPSLVAEQFGFGSLPFLLKSQ